MFEKWKAKRLRNKIEVKRLESMLEVLESTSNRVRDDDTADNWRILQGGKAYYTEPEMKEMQGAASKHYYTNPIAYGVIETMINFIIGESMTITPCDEAQEVKDYWQEFYELNNLDMRIKELVRRAFRDGESFLRFFENFDNKPPFIRFVNPTEIVDWTGMNTYGIQTDPDDIEKVIKYYREWQLYTSLNKTEIQRETIEADDIIHTKIKVDSDVKRGVSFFVGIAPYLTKYQRWLDDRIELNRLRTIFNVVANIKAPTGAANVKAMFPDISPTDDTGVNDRLRKEAPKSGSVLFAKGVEWDLKNLNIQAQDAKADGRAILLMVTAGTNLAEYVVTGDTSNANYASTMVSESPMVKTFESWQDFFGKTIQQIYSKVIEGGIKNGAIKERSTKTIKEYDPETKTETERTEPCDTDLTCQVDFPVLIHRDIKSETESLVLQVNEGWASNRTASSKLGYDYDEEQRQLEKESAEGESQVNQEGDETLKQEFIARQTANGDMSEEEAAMLFDSGQR